MSSYQKRNSDKTNFLFHVTKFMFFLNQPLLNKVIKVDKIATKFLFNFFITFISQPTESSRTLLLLRRMFHQIILGDRDDSSDDMPLLFSPISGPSSLHSSQELEHLDHCHGQEPRRDSSRKAKRQLAIATVLCSIFVTGKLAKYLKSSSNSIISCFLILWVLSVNFSRVLYTLL